MYTYLLGYAITHILFQSGPENTFIIYEKKYTFLFDRTKIIFEIIKSGKFINVYLLITTVCEMKEHRKMLENFKKFRVRRWNNTLS